MKQAVLFNNVLKKTFLMLGLISFCVAGFGRIIQNQSEIGFSIEGRSMIRTLIIQSAGYYLQSHSDLLLFLNRVEMSDLQGFNFEEARMILDNGVFQMENALKTYQKLAAAAETVPYNQDVVQQLVSMDYRLLSDSDNSLALTSAGRLGQLLKDGDIRGVYYKMIQDTEQILALLTEIKNNVDNGVVPSNELLWRVSELYSETLVFGHKSAAVFYRISGN